MSAFGAWDRPDARKEGERRSKPSRWVGLVQRKKSERRRMMTELSHVRAELHRLRVENERLKAEAKRRGLEQE